MRTITALVALLSCQACLTSVVAEDDLEVECIAAWDRFVGSINGKQVSFSIKEESSDYSGFSFWEGKGTDTEIFVVVNEDRSRWMSEAVRSTFVYPDRKVFRKGFSGTYCDLGRISVGASSMKDLESGKTSLVVSGKLDSFNRSKLSSGSATKPLFDDCPGGTYSNLLRDNMVEVSKIGRSDSGAELIEVRCRKISEYGDYKCRVTFSKMGKVLRPYKVVDSYISNSGSISYSNEYGPFSYVGDSRLPSEWRSVRERQDEGAISKSTVKVTLVKVRKASVNLDSINFQSIRIPDGQRVYIEGQDVIRFEYHGGQVYKMVDGGALQSLDGANFTPPTFWSKTKFLWLAGGVVILVIVGGRFYQKRAKTSRH